MLGLAPGRQPRGGARRLPPADAAGASRPRRLGRAGGDAERGQAGARPGLSYSAGCRSRTLSRDRMRRAVVGRARDPAEADRDSGITTLTTIQLVIARTAEKRPAARCRQARQVQPRTIRTVQPRLLREVECDRRQTRRRRRRSTRDPARRVELGSLVLDGWRRSGAHRTADLVERHPAAVLETSTCWPSATRTSVTVA